jgi:ABC-type nitrate/sulfonate/bicarbonate transport system permease component
MFQTTQNVRLRRSPSQPRRKVLSARAELALGLAGIATVIVVWGVASATGALSPSAVPPPLDVARALGALLASGDFWLALLQTVIVALSGVVIVILIAVPLAMAIHGSFAFRESTWFVLEFLKPIPPVALIPLTILLWGPTKSVELFLVVFAALWPMLTQLVYGLREVSGTALDVARVYRFSSWQRTWRIVVPSLMPFAMTGLRISVTMALVVSIVTEYIVGIPGLGAMLSTSQVNGLLDRMYALIVAMGLLGLAMNGGITLLNKPVLFWHASQREKVSA